MKAEVTLKREIELMDLSNINKLNCIIKHTNPFGKKWH